MTCIVGIAQDGEVYIGADSAGCAGDAIFDRSDKKVFVNGGLIFGFTSSYRMGQLLAYRLKLPPHPDGMDVMEYLCVLFVDSVRACMKEGGFLWAENSRESGGAFLIGYRGRLFSVDDDFQIGEYFSGLAAVGSGQPYALAAMHSCTSKNPYFKMTTALAVAEKLSRSVRAPFFFVSTQGAGVVSSTDFYIDKEDQ